LANAQSEDELVKIYEKLTEEVKAKPGAPARVIYARDTRASGSTLVACLKDALDATGTEYTDYKHLTTPQLHYLVRCVNTKGTQYEYGEISEQGYYKKLAAAYKQAMKHKKTSGPVTVDCANGVGGPKLNELKKHLPGASEGGIDIKVVNDDVLKPESLNSQVPVYIPCILEKANANTCSAAPTSSKPNSAHHPHPRFPPATAVPPSTATPTA